MKTKGKVKIVYWTRNKTNGKKMKKKEGGRALWHHIGIIPSTSLSAGTVEGATVHSGGTKAEWREEALSGEAKNQFGAC